MADTVLNGFLVASRWEDDVSLCTPLTPWQAERVRSRRRLAAYLDRVAGALAS